MHTTRLLFLALFFCGAGCTPTGLAASDTHPTTGPGRPDIGPVDAPAHPDQPDIEYPIYPIDFASPPDASDLVQSCAVSSDCMGTGQVCCIVPASGAARYECLALADCVPNYVVACRNVDDCASSGQGACCKDAGPDHCCME